MTIDAITRPTTEYRDQLRTAPENVIRTLVATGWAVTISTCVREFQQRFPEADVEIVDEFDEDKGEDD